MLDIDKPHVDPRFPIPERHPSGNQWTRAGLNVWTKKKIPFLRHIADNEMRVMETLRLLGIPKVSFDRWRQNDPVFKEYCEMAKLIRGGPNNGHRWMKKEDPADPKSFTDFRKRYFGFSTFYHQAQIKAAIDSTPPGGVTMVLVPPEFGKTSFMEDYCNWKVATNPDVRITIVSEGQPHARKILNRVKRRMVDKRIAPAYINDFGPFLGDTHRTEGRPWSADFFTVAQSAHDERDYTVEARGWRAAIAGTRTDLLLVDDIQSRRSLNQTQQMLETFRQDFLTRPGKEGITVIVGTRVGIGDFYEACLLEGIVDQLVELPAVDKDGRSLCPEMWPDEALIAKRRKVGEATWWRNYMQAPKKAGNQTFTKAMVEGACDLGRRLGEVRSGIVKVCGLDPAIKGRTALCVAAYSTNRFEVLDAYSEGNLGSTEAILARVDAAAALHRFDTLVVETNAFQHGLLEDLRLQALSREHGFRIVPHLTGRNKLDEDLGVARIPSSFTMGEMSIPYGDVSAVERMDQFIEELYNWRPHESGTRLRQDIVMAFWFCWLQWNAHRQGAITKPKAGLVMKKKHRLPYAPTRIPTQPGGS